MTDLALAYDPATHTADLCIADGDLVLDDGLSSLVLMSLLTDARAAPEDVDAGEQDLRGWWGDAFSERALGGRLWTLGRALATDETARRARDFALEALAWLMVDGIAAAVNVEATRTDGDGSGATLALDVEILRFGPGRDAVSLRYDFLWRAMQ
ncbi:MAG: phage GP46 family protein [Pseudomonadota bacterium]